MADSQVKTKLIAAFATKQKALTTAQLAAVDSGITSAKVSAYDGYENTKADKATTLSGYGITNAYTKTEADSAISTAVSPKADKTYVDNQLELKANEADVESALALKADASSVYTKSETYSKTEVDGKVAGAYHFKGSVASPSALPTSGQSAGDVYDLLAGGVINEDTDFEKTVLAGTNVAWVAAVSGAVAHWDPLSGTIDLSAYATTEYVDEGLAEKQDSLSDAQISATNSGITATKVAGYDSHVADEVAHITSAERSSWNGKQDELDDDQMAAVNSGITAAKVTKLEGIDAGAEVNVIETIKVDGTALTVTGKAVNIDLSGKADASHTHVASDVNAMTGYSKSTTGYAALAATDTLNAAMGKLEGGLQDIMDACDTVISANS